MELTEDDYLEHYGIIRRSGRYPWGSGGNATTTKNNRSFLDFIKELLGKGLSETEIAEGFGMSTTELRNARSLARSEEKLAQVAMAVRLKEKSYSNVAAAAKMGIPESTFRTLIDPATKEKLSVIQNTADLLKRQVDEQGGYLDVGKGTEMYLGVSPERLRTALSLLRSEGYNVHTNIKEGQLGTDKKTDFKVLTKDDKTWGDVMKNRDKITQPFESLKDTGNEALGVKPPKPLDPKRVDVVYGPDGGAQLDGVMYVRPGVEDLSLGGSRYAQVRVQVGKDRYLKGMAIYKDDLPDGVDVLFHTNKTKEEAPTKLDVLKEIKKDGPLEEFGATVRRQITDDKGNVTSVMNLINEEGDWSNWSDSIASQVLSKQPVTLARQQLNMTAERRKNEFDEIMALSNPTVKKKLLEEFAASADSAAVNLKAASLPRQAWQVILPVPDLKDTEVYAPNFQQGEKVVLIRYPHGGTFEIPELQVNNSHPSAKKMLGQSRDAIGINAKVAERLSGADFDGDTVLVIPDNAGRIRVTRALKQLENFDHRGMYKIPDGPEGKGIKRMTKGMTGAEMGKISNLITDMTIKQAPRNEIARAVRHSMVVIDAEKHGLNYKQSEIDNGIKKLREQYQTKDDGTGGAATLISRAKSPLRVEDFKPRTHKNGGPINKETGELEFEPTGYTNWRTGKPKLKKVKALEVTRDAHELSSGTPIERLYADHSNKLKGMANRARLAAINTPTAKRQPSAKNTYSKEVKRLEAALRVAEQNAPRERRAQVIANAQLRAIKQDDPTMSLATQKKTGYKLLEEARRRTGAQRERIEISQEEWNAIQAGALSDSKVRRILNHTDMDKVREYATPKSRKLMNSTKINSARSKLALGYTREQVARQLGVSISTLDEALGGG